MPVRCNTIEFGYSARQERVFRAVAGAVKNACDGHRAKWRFDQTFARSIAKRATGTLTSQWPELAAPSPSERGVLLAVTDKAPQHVVGLPATRERRERGAFQTALPGRRRSPLKFLHDRIGAMCGEAKHAGQHERAEALKEVLRLIGAERKRVDP